MSAPRIAADDLRLFAQHIMQAHAVDDVQAASVAEVMVWNDLVGRANHGVQRLKILMERVTQNVLNRSCHPVFEDRATSMALLNGDGGFGYHIGRIGMERAIELAREHGVGAVGVHNSNFFGTGAYFVNQPAKTGMVGIALSNSFPKVTSHGGNKPVLGTNPIAFGAPRRNGHSLMLDMATAAGAGSTVREHMQKGTPLPEGIAIDAEGNPVTDPAKVSAGTMLPFGGAKGYGLSLMVEILGGVITGAGISHGVASMYKDFARNGNNGHFLLALDISRWMPMKTYYQRFEMLVDIIKASSDTKEVLLPGETRWQHYENNLQHGIALDSQNRKLLLELSIPHNIEPPWPKD